MFVESTEEYIKIVPVLRWPGGCLPMNTVHPTVMDKRKSKRSSVLTGGVTENNHLGHMNSLGWSNNRSLKHIGAITI